MKESLVTRKESQIATPGCRLFAQGLQVERELTDAECRQALSALQSMRTSTEFWFGDLLAYDLGRRGVPREKQGDWLTEFAHVRGLDAHEVKRWVNVSDYFPVQERLPLSFSHHVEAMKGAGDDRQLAWSWLGEAAKEGLSASQFRAKIRKAQMKGLRAASDDVLDPGPPEDDADREVAAIERWTLQRMPWLQRATPDQAAAILRDLRHTADFIDGLRERVRSEAPPVKESITGAV